MSIQVLKAVSREGFIQIDERKFLPMFKRKQSHETWYFVVQARSLKLQILEEAKNYINHFSKDGRQWAIAEFE